MKMTEKEFQNRYRIRVLKSTERVKTFLCGDDDLDNFILEEATLYGKAKISVTYIVTDSMIDDEVVAYFSLANDKLSVNDFASNSEFNRFRKHRFSHEKRLRSYPAVKLCRLGVQDSMKGTGIGSILLRFMIRLYLFNSRAGCRFITVDAYKSAVSFYEANGFLKLTRSSEEAYTVPLYFDLCSLIE